MNGFHLKRAMSMSLLRLRPGCAVLAVALLGGAPVKSQGATLMYLYVTNAPGEVTNPPYAGWIQIDSFSHGLSKVPNALPNHSAVSISKQLDTSSPKLMEACNQGRIIPNVKLEFTKSTGSKVRYYQIVLTNALVSDFSTSSSGDRPFELASFVYSQIGWLYVELNATDAPITNWSAYWDIPNNQGGTSSAQVVFRVKSLQVNATTAQLTWTSQEGKTYEIRASGQVDGPYLFIKTVPSAGDGETSTTLPRVPSNQFFLVVEQ